METVIKVAYDQMMLLFAAPEPHFQSALEKYCELFRLNPEDCYDEVYLAAGDPKNRLWVISDDHGEDRFFSFGKPEKIKDMMKDYISRFGNPKGSYLAVRFVRVYYMYDDSEVLKSLQAHPVPFMEAP